MAAKTHVLAKYSRKLFSLLFLASGAFLHYYGATTTSIDPETSLSSIIHIGGRSYDGKPIHNYWSMDWCGNNGDGNDNLPSHVCLPEETVSITVKSSSNMSTILQQIFDKAHSNKSKKTSAAARCIKVQQQYIIGLGNLARHISITERLAPYFKQSVMARIEQKSTSSGGKLRDSASSLSVTNDIQDTSSFLLHLWDLQPNVRSALCQRLPDEEFVALYFPTHASIPSLISLNKLQKNISEHVAVILEDIEGCQHRVSVLQLLQGKHRTFWSICDGKDEIDVSTEDQELADIVAFLWELYAFAEAKQVVGGDTAGSNHHALASLVRRGKNTK